MASLGLIPSLTRLDISHCAGASDCSLEALGALTALRHVSLLGCENFRGRCFGSWNRMTALKSVDVSRCAAALSPKAFRFRPLTVSSFICHA